jgi:hypothetical protein
VQALVEALVGTDGTVRSADGENAADYGIGTPATIRVSLAGPRAFDDQGGDVRASFDVGASVPGRDAAFVRRTGRPEIWCLDADPRALLEPGGDLPPLVDARVAPADWPGWEQGLARVTIERGGGDLVLERRVLAPDELARPDTGAPALWRLVTAAGEEHAANLLAHGYTLFLQRARFTSVLAGPGELDGERRAALGFDAPAARVVLVAGDAPPLELLLAAPRSDGRVAVLEPASGVAALVDGAVAELLAPQPAWLLPDAETNRWDPYLR